MGCGGSKHGVAAAGASTVSYRRIVRTSPGAANSEVKSPATFPVVAGEVAPATATTASAVVPDVKDLAVNVDLKRAGSEEEAAGKPEPDDPPGRCSSLRTDDEEGGGREGRGGGTFIGDAPAVPSAARGSEEAGSCMGEGRGQDGRVHNPGGEETICGVCDLDGASKPDVCGDERRDQEDNLTPKHDGQVESPRRQLQQVAEQLAHFEIWSPEDDDSDDSEEDITGREEHEEEDPKSIKEPVFEEEDQSSDAPEVTFKEDFSNKVPVYDEDPFDLLQVPSIGRDFCTQGSAIASYLLFGKVGVGDEQIEQVLYQTFMKVGRSKLHGSEGKKKRTHYQLRHKQIRKHRKRRTYKLVH